MKKFIIISAAVLFLANSLNAQLYDPDFTEFYNKTEFIKTLSKPEYTYTGSPYLESEFIPGDIYMSNDKVFKDIPLRYNIYNDLFEFEVEGQAYTINENASYRKIVIGNGTFIPSSYTYGGGVKKGHLEIVSEGEYTLLKKHGVDLEPATLPGAYKEAKPANFRSLKPEFFMSVSGTAGQFFNNANSLEKICNCDVDALDAFIKKNKIKFNREDSLVRLTEYLNNR